MEKNKMNDTAMDAVSTAKQSDPEMVVMIGKRRYVVGIHFSKTSTETMGDKLKRMVKRDIDSGVLATV